MYYYLDIIQRRGQFGIIWLAAFDRAELKKRKTVAMINACSVDKCCEDILKYAAEGRQNSPRMNLYVTSTLVCGLCKLLKVKSELIFDDAARIFVKWGEVARLLSIVDTKDAKRFRRLHVMLNTEDRLERLILEPTQPMQKKARKSRREDDYEVPVLTHEELAEILRQADDIRVSNPSQITMEELQMRPMERPEDDLGGLESLMPELQDILAGLDPSTVPAAPPAEEMSVATADVPTEIPPEPLEAPAQVAEKVSESVLEEPQVQASAVPQEQVLVQPPEKAPEQPIEQAKEQPMEQVPEQPMEQVPEQPMEQVPELPMEQVPEQPMDQVPEQPMNQVPEQPMDQVPEQPMEQAPEQPMDQVPEQPMDQVLEQPMDQVPEQPMEQAPEQPMEQVPEQPMEQIPEQPMDQVPERPMEQAPEADLQQQPAPVREGGRRQHHWKRDAVIEIPKKPVFTANIHMLISQRERMWERKKRKEDKLDTISPLAHLLDCFPVPDGPAPDFPELNYELRPWLNEHEVESRAMQQARGSISEGHSSFLRVSAGSPTPGTKRRIQSGTSPSSGTKLLPDMTEGLLLIPEIEYVEPGDILAARPPEDLSTILEEEIPEKRRRVEEELSPSSIGQLTASSARVEANLLSMISDAAAQTDSVTFAMLAPPESTSRYKAACLFTSLLNLEKKMMLKTQQNEPYGDIVIDLK